MLPTITGTATSEQPQTLGDTDWNGSVLTSKISFLRGKDSNLFQGSGAILFLSLTSTSLSAGEQEDMNYLEAFQIIKKLLLFP